MPVLGCGAEMSKLMDVSDQDVQTIEDVIQERIGLGVSQPVAQRQAVAEALAQLAEERSMVMKAIDEQLGKEAAFAKKAGQDDLFPEEFATKRTKGDSGVVVSSKGETLKGANINSDGQQITATKQGVDNFWKWFGDSVTTDDKGRPLVLYHSTNADTDVLKAGQKTTNNYGLLGDVELSRAGIFATADRNFSQEYLRSGDGKNVMQIYMSLRNPFDTRNGISYEAEQQLIDAGVSSRWLYDYRQHDWEMYDNADDGTNFFVEKLKELGYDGAVFNEEGQDGETHTTYMAFDSNQIKSATGNLGTFNPADDRVVFARKANQTDTPEFKRWFGNSKVVDAKGKPLVVYHGTTKSFDAFDPNAEPFTYESDRGLQFFLDNPHGAGEYALGTQEAYGGAANVMPVYLRMENPRVENVDGPPSEFWDSEGPSMVSAYPDVDGFIIKGDGETMYVTRDPKQIKSAIGNNGQFDPENPDIRFARKAEQTETPEFKKWSGGAPLVELEAEHDYRSGQPVVVEALHGTTNAGLTKFSRGKANIESDFGAGFYASNTPSDVATNYANNDGPDLTRRVERLAERIEEDDEFEGDHGEALRMARAQLSEAAPNTMKLYMRFSNPAVLGGRGETYFDYNESYDEETDEYGEPEGLLVDFVNALDDAGDGLDISMRDLEDVKAALFEQASGEGIKFADLISIVKEKAMDVSSVEDGSSGSSELLRQALEGMGFDGVIDTTVSNKFGPYKIVNGERYSRGGGMKGMHEGTVHFIAFTPNQLKSATGNNGDFSLENDDVRFARKANTEGKVFDRDVTGRVKLAAPRQLSELMPAKAWMRLMDKWYLTQPSEALRNELRKMKIDVQHSMDTAGELSAEVNKLSMAEREQVSDIIEKELKAGVTPAANAVRTADLMNQAFRTQTDELVRLGMLSQDAADRWRDKYIPRYYESKLPGAVKDTWASFVGKLSGQVRPLQGIKGKHLKGRGMVNTIPAADLAKWQAQGWEVRDKSYDPATSEQVMVWRDFTKEEREKMGEIRDAGFRFVLGYMQTQRDIAIGRMYERLANDPQWSSTTEKQDWLRVPDTTIPGTGALRYGKLAGRWVPKEVLSQLQTEHEMDSEAFALYKKALAYWKSNKTVMNPVGHLNNFVSNLTMAHFAGVSYWDAHKYGAAIRDFATGAPGLKAARDAGLFIGGLTDAELQNMMPAELRHMLGRTDSAGIKGLKVVDAILTFGQRNRMSKAYEFGDKFFKYLIYQDAVKNGATPEEAVNHAQRYIFTYDDLPKGARRIRDYGVPFFAYTYKAIPALAHTAMAYPWRFAAPATIIGVANAIGYALAAGGDDDDWWESIKKYFSDAEFRKEADTLADEEYSKLPEWMKGHSAMGTKKQIRLGTDEVTGNPVFLDVSRFIPGGDLFDITGNAGGIPWLQPLTPNNPLLSIYSAMFANKEPFFGKDLVDKRTDDVWDATGKRAKYLWQLATPAIAMGNATWDRLIGVAANKYGDELPYLPDALGGDITGVGKDGQPIQAKYAIPQSVGVKARPIDMEMSDSIDQAERRKTLSELEAQLRKARRANGNGVMSDRAFDKAEEKIRTKMDRVRDGLTIDGNEKD